MNTVESQLRPCPCVCLALHPAQTDVCTLVAAAHGVKCAACTAAAQGPSRAKTTRRRRFRRSDRKQVKTG